MLNFQIETYFFFKQVINKFFLKIDNELLVEKSTPYKSTI